jgi:dTDP-glucose pyrophosphorylase
MTLPDEVWRKALLPLNSQLKDAIQVLNYSGLKIVLVEDDNGKFLGTISDGDIRRGLLNGLILESKVSTIINNQPLVASKKIDKAYIVQLMKTNKVQQVPIIENEKLVGLYFWDDLNSPNSIQNLVVIMAGGMGTRLLPQTKECPKPLLPVAGKPILEHIIERAKAEGFFNFLIAIHHLGHLIEEYFGDGGRFGVSIEYLRENSPLGTAGALSLIDPFPNLPLVVTNGDLITDVHLAEILNFHEIQQASATMAIRTQEWQNPFGVVQTNGIEISGYEEKPITYSQVNAGVYVLNPSELSLLPKSQSCDMPELFLRIRESGKRLVAFPLHEQWIDIGRPRDLEFIRSRVGLD